jgi:hypothetical protein
MTNAVLWRYSQTILFCGHSCNLCGHLGFQYVRYDETIYATKLISTRHRSTSFVVMIANHVIIAILF